MLHDNCQLGLTATGWINLSSLTLEPVASLKQRIKTVERMREFLEGLMEDFSGVPEEIELLRMIFLPWHLERLSVKAFKSEEDDPD